MFVIARRPLSFVIGDTGAVVAEDGKPKLFQDVNEAQAYYEAMTDGATLAENDCIIRNANEAELAGTGFTPD